MTMMSMISDWRLKAPFFLCALTLPFFTAADAPDLPTLQLTPYTADYIVYRNGKSHGKAQRELLKEPQHYLLRYQSEVSWMIFSDRREEQTRFLLKGSKVKPIKYTMTRRGTGPGRDYLITMDPAKEELRVGKDQTLKTEPWHDDWLDQLSYHQQLAIDLAAGEREFSYEVLNRSGDAKTYHFRVVTEELLPLPYANVRALRIERVDDDSDRQIYAWVAPELDYLLVRLWRGENNVEQFDVQLHKVNWH
jgi:hypothetical protein